MMSLERARELIDAGTAPPTPEGMGALRAALRRLAVRAGRPNAIHQQQVNRELSALLEALTAQMARVSERADGLQSGIEELRGWLDELQRRTTANEQRVHDLQRWNHELAERAGDAERRMEPLEANLAASRATPGMTDLKLEPLDGGPAGIGLGYVNGIEAGDEDASYLAFENTFRGSVKLIRGRQEIYVPLLLGHDPVLDVGCGRGELLALLRDAHIKASGIDLNPAMVESCHADGLTEVSEGEGVSHLASLEGESLGAVIALQVIEHLTYQELVTFVRETYRVLRPGGRFIAETINPHAPQAMKTFWVDRSHQGPVFPEVAIALCRTTAFARAFVFHPGGSGDAERDRFTVPDYAVVADKATEEPVDGADDDAGESSRPAAEGSE